MVGISRDKLRSQRKFASGSSLGYPLLADPRGDAIRAYGVRGFAGFARRTTFLIDPAGRIHKVYQSVSPHGHAAEVLHDLLGLVRT